MSTPVPNSPFGPGPIPQISEKQIKVDLALLNSPFAKMLGPTATPQEIQEAINLILKQTIQQIKKEQQDAVAAIKKMKKVAEGEDPD